MTEIHIHLDDAGALSIDSNSKDKLHVLGLLSAAQSALLTQAPQPRPRIMPVAGFMPEGPPDRRNPGPAR